MSSSVSLSVIAERSTAPKVSSIKVRLLGIPLASGNALPPLIESDAVSVTLENAVVAPLLVVSAVPPTVPLALSHARKVNVALSVELRAGT